MSITFGFYNSLNGDRKYDAIQMSSMFDGLILDGIFASIGTCFVVKADAGNFVTVGEGKAWFNNTWTKNDSVLPIEASISELLLDRIDTLVLEVNTTEPIRANSIKFISGTPATSPVAPILTKTAGIYQYPLCTIYRKSGSSEIVQADITNKVGSTESPFITGLLQTISLDALLGQWEDELDRFVVREESDFTAWMNTEKAEYDSWIGSTQASFNVWMSAQKTAFDNWMNAEKAEYKSWFEALKADLLSEQKFLNDWIKSEQSDFTAWMNTEKAEYDSWIEIEQAGFFEWFNEMKNQLSQDSAGKLQLEIDRNEINRVLSVGFADGSKVFSDDGTIINSTDSGGRTLTKTFTDGFLKMTNILKSSSGSELANMVKIFDSTGKTICTTITYK